MRTRDRLAVEQGRPLMAYKRGPASSGQYLIRDRQRVPREFADLALRRVMPFMDVTSIQTRSLSHILSEVYLQGIRDAYDTLESKGRILDEPRGLSAIKTAERQAPAKSSPT